MSNAVNIPGHYAYQLPALLALAGIGTAGGALLSNKKKRLEGMLFGGASLPLAYLAYLAAQKGYNLEGNAFDRFVNKNINNPVHAWLNPYKVSDGTSVEVTYPNRIKFVSKDNSKVRASKQLDGGKEEDLGYVPNWLNPLVLTINPNTNKYEVIDSPVHPGAQGPEDTSEEPVTQDDVSDAMNGTSVRVAPTNLP